MKVLHVLRRRYTAPCNGRSRWVAEWDVPKAEWPVIDGITATFPTSLGSPQKYEDELIVLYEEAD